MTVAGRSRRLLWPLVLLAVGLGLAALPACGNPYRLGVTPTPTRTPRPTATPTPSPTPTPTWPLAVGCESSVPEEACARLRGSAEEDPAHFAWTDELDGADLLLTTQAATGSLEAGRWTYAVAAPFYTAQDDVSMADLHAAWLGAPGSPLGGHPLVVATATLQTLSSFWEAPSAGQVQVVAASDLLTEAVRLDAWAILPFGELEPRWKVLRVDGLSLLDKGLETESYPLSLPFYLAGERTADARALLPADLSNRRATEMAVVAMTGVTALTRGTAQTMEQMGVTYPARDIAEWLRGADLTHISNEVSFTPDCPTPPPQGTMLFCSHDRYIGLLETVGADIVELTGNHNNDYGTGPNLHTLDMFQERGWRWFGGGANLADATRAVTVTLGTNRLAFLGCNAVGPDYAWATEDGPGAARCKEKQDWELLLQRIAELRAAGWLPIVTVQFYETYEYFPTPQQVTDFRALAEAGAVVVQGSQAHQPQGFDFHAGAFIHYGLGNLFFDQMQSLGTRQEFVDRLVFHGGRLVSVELGTFMLEEYARPRPTTAEERRELLEAVFAASAWSAP